MTPWAEEKFKASKPSFGPHPVEESNDPAYRCLPNAVPRVYAGVQAANADRRAPGPHADVLRSQHTPNLHGRASAPCGSSAHVDGALDRQVGWRYIRRRYSRYQRYQLARPHGPPHSDKLHLIERFRRVDDKTMLINITLDDPIAYTKTWDIDARERSASGRTPARGKRFARTCLKTKPSDFTRFCPPCSERIHLEREAFPAFSCWRNTRIFHSPRDLKKKYIDIQLKRC